MNKRTNLWSPDEDESLRQMKSQGLSFRKIATSIGRTWCSTVHRWRLLNIKDEERESRSERARTYRAERRRRDSGHKQRGVDCVRPLVIPDVVFEERNERLSAPRSLTGFICGDPPAGYSALDRRAAQ
jgi:hypothetical protein